jgi:hypothetical protein
MVGNNMPMGMGLQSQGFVGGMSDTGAAPDSSGGSSTMNMMGPNGEQMHPT